LCVRVLFFVAMYMCRRIPFTLPSVLVRLHVQAALAISGIRTHIASSISGGLVVVPRKTTARRLQLSNALSSKLGGTGCLPLTLASFGAGQWDGGLGGAYCTSDAE
jgi:hypothetical protein